MLVSRSACQKRYSRARMPMLDGFCLEGSPEISPRAFAGWPHELATVAAALERAGETDEQEEIELPNLDEEPGEEDEATGLGDEAPPVIDVPDVELDPFDDADAEELSVDEIDPVPDDEARADDEVREIDDGSPTEGLVTGDAEDPLDDEDGLTVQDAPELDSDPDDEDDGGAEGTSEAIEDEVDESALPDLDSDDEVEFEDQELIAAVGAEEAPLPPWSSSRWHECQGAAATTRCTAVGVAGGRVFAVGNVIFRVEQGELAARRSASVRAAVSVVADADALYIATRRGQLMVVRDTLAPPTPLPGWRARGALELAATSDRLWVRCDDALWCVAIAPGGGARLAPESVRATGVRAIAAADGAAIALTIDHGVPSVERRYGDDEGWRAAVIRGGAARAALDPSARLAASAGGRNLAILGEQLVCASRDGGATFDAIALPCAAAAAFAGAAPDAPLLVLIGRPGHEAGYLVEVACTGETALLAQVPGAFPEANDDGPLPGSAALAWDGSRELVWVASGAGLGAFARTPRH